MVDEEILIKKDAVDNITKELTWRGKDAEEYVKKMKITIKNHYKII